MCTLSKLTTLYAPEHPNPVSGLFALDFIWCDQLFQWAFWISSSSQCIHSLFVPCETPNASLYASFIGWTNFDSNWGQAKMIVSCTLLETPTSTRISFPDSDPRHELWIGYRTTQTRYGYHDTWILWPMFDDRDWRDVGCGLGDIDQVIVGTLLVALLGFKFASVTTFSYCYSVLCSLRSYKGRSA